MEVLIEFFYKYSTSAREAWWREIRSPWPSKFPFPLTGAGLCRSSDEEIGVETYMACGHDDSPSVTQFRLAWKLKDIWITVDPFYFKDQDSAADGTRPVSQYRGCALCLCSVSSTNRWTHVFCLVPCQSGLLETLEAPVFLIYFTCTSSRNSLKIVLLVSSLWTRTKILGQLQMQLP